MSEAVTGIYLVDDMHQALEVAETLGMEGIGLDLEGVLYPFIGNEPTKEDMSREVLDAELVAYRAIAAHRFGRWGIMTNNTNTRFPGYDYGLVEQAAARLSVANFRVPAFFKGMQMSDGTILRGKPSGDQGRAFVEQADLNPVRTALIDDQGVKNAGEAVRAGFGAIIVPRPVGEIKLSGKVIEHPGVMAFRHIEPLVYRSLRTRGNVAAAAYKMVANIELSEIADFVNLRNKQ